MSIARKIGNVADVLDSAATGDFFAKGSADGQFQEIAYSSLVGTPTAIDSALTSQLIDSAYIQLRQTSAAAGLDSATTINLIDSSYVAARSSSSGSSGFDIFNYTATNNQTTFQDSSSDGTVLSYTENGILVYYNGLLLADEDYTATSGSSVVLTSGADSGASIAIAKWSLGGGGGGSSAVWYGSRGLIAVGERSGSSTNTIDYNDITTPGNASDFGDLSTATAQGTAAGSADRAIFKLGLSAGTTMEYVTPSTTGNATDFGDTSNGGRMNSAVADGTYMLIHGGNFVNNYNAVIEYVTIATAGNSSSFGNGTETCYDTMSTGDATRGMHKLVHSGNQTYTTMEYTTIATPGNATDFGDDNTSIAYGAGFTSGGTAGRAILCGGTEGVNPYAKKNNITYFTIQTTGNSSDFGDLTRSPDYTTSTSDYTYGITCGGRTTSSETNVVDYVTIDTTGNASDFGDLVGTCMGAFSTSGAAA